MFTSLLLGYSLVLPLLSVDIKNETVNNYTTTPESIHFTHLDTSVTCKFQPNGFDCDSSGRYRPKFYYDLKLQDCKSYTFGTCPYNLNSYNTLSDCHNSCRDVGMQPVPENLKPRIFCRLQHDFGYCHGYNPRWYFDMTSRRCKGFSYSGCGGNFNRFRTQQDCVTICTGVTDFKPDAT